MPEGVFTPSMLEQIIRTLMCFISMVSSARREQCQLNLGGTENCKTQRMTTAVGFVESVRRSLDEIMPTYKGLEV